MSLLSLAGIAACASTAAAGPVLSSKRGFADVGASYGLLQATGAGWYYTWGLGPANPGNFDAEFAPMFWGGWAVNQGNIDAVKNNPDVEWVLGFNEPERGDQANMTVDQAVNAWRTLSDGFEGTDKLLVTPAVSDTSEGRAWMQEFHNRVVAEGLKVDAVAFHWYGWSSPDNPQQAASNFIGAMNWYRNLWNKPVMCTEFAIHDWGGVHSTEAMIEANRQFLDIVIPWLESTEWVAGYAFYPWFSSAPLWEGSPPTPTAMAYEHTGVIRSGEIYDIAGTNHGEHVAFLDGGRLTNTGAVGTALRYINALSGRSMIRGTLDWGLEPGGWMRVQPGATLRKVDSFGLSLDGGSLWNAGVIEIDDGTISVDRPVTGDGRITIGTYGNSTVASLELADSAIVSNSIGFRGRHTDTPAIVNTSGEGIVSGTMTIEVGGVDYILRSQAGSLTLAGARSIEAPPNMGDRLITLDGAGDGAVRGTITDEPGSTVSILKAGEGTWMLAAQNDYAGSTTVASGTLALEGRTGTGLTTIETGAILTGGGVVRGDLLAASGSTLRIGAEGLEPSSSSLLAQVDGFENYPLGPIGAVPNTTGDAWTGVFDGTGYAEIVENSGNRALAVHGLGGLDWRGAIADLSAHPISGNASLASGEVGTYFLRLRRNEPGAVYAVLGLTDLPASIASPPGNNTSTPYNDYAVTLTLIGTESGTLLRAFSEGAGNIPVTTVLDGEWLNLWLVVDNASKTFRVATSTGTDPGVDTGTEFNFGQRTGPEVGTSPIRTIGIHEGRGIFVEVDDLHFTEGEVLTNPLDADELRGEILTVQGDATLAPGSRVRVDIGDSGTSDRLSVQGALQLGGELEVSLDPSASINAGDRYDILDFSSVSGSFDVLSLPALPSGLAWDTTSLLVDGDLVAAGGCGPADIAVPYGQLDLADISAFVASFISSDPVADLDGNGVFDLADLSGFIAAFTAGCP